MHNPVEVGALLFYTYPCCIYTACYFTHFIRLLLLPPWQFGGHRCFEPSGRLARTAVPLPRLATPFGFLAKSINQAWSGASACACTVKSPYIALVSTKTNLCQAPPWHASHGKQTAQANRAPHESVCHTYATHTLRSGSPLHRVTEGKGQLPGSPQSPRCTHKEKSCQMPSRCCGASVRSPPQQTREPSQRISFLFCFLPAVTSNRHVFPGSETAAFILQVKKWSS